MVQNQGWVPCMCGVYVYHGAGLITLGIGTTLGIGATLGREAGKLCGIGVVVGWTGFGAGSGGIGTCVDGCCGLGGCVTCRNMVSLVACC